MATRISWDQYEVALLFDAYEKVSQGANINDEATRLSVVLRHLAEQRGISIDETYRNVNGMKMQLANVQYLFTEGKKGLSGASVMIRQMYEIYQTEPKKYRTLLKEALQMTAQNTRSIEDAFFEYAKDKNSMSPEMLSDYLQKASDYCHLKQPLLGMTDVKAVRNVQQKVSEGTLLRFRYGKKAQGIRTATQLYYSFIKSHREAPKQTVAVAEPVMAEKQSTEARVLADALVIEMSPAATVSSSDQLWVDFAQDNSYLFTKPISYIYKGQSYPAKSWNRIYVEICGLLFADHRDAFLHIMNGDITGYNALAFADAQNAQRMRSPKAFAPGYYLESNLDATSIVRKLRGLYQLFNVGDDLQITYRLMEGNQSAQPKVHRETGTVGQLDVDEGYDWHRAGLQLVDFYQDVSYAFTKPEAYEYNGITRCVNTWGKLYADLCGALFEDYRDAFMGIMNGDTPGYNTLAFADEQHKSSMRVARQFAPGFYLESNIDATTIVRRIRGLHQLFDLGGRLRISYTKTKEVKATAIADEPEEEWIIRELREKKIVFVDNRDVGGCLWVASDMNIPVSLTEAATHGYHFKLKQDGCRAFPDRPVLWTKDKVKKSINTAAFRRALDENFKPYLLTVKKLASPTTAQYSQSVEAVERFIHEKGMRCTLDVDDPVEAQRIYAELLARDDFVAWNNQRHHQYSAALAQYVDYLRHDGNAGESYAPNKQMTIQDVIIEKPQVDDRWLSILRDYFPEGYMLNDFLSQFQASAYWQQQYGEICPIAGETIDNAMRAVGAVRDGRVFARSEANQQLIAAICAEINDILSCYTTVFRSCIYDRYHDQLAACQIYTEPVMTQQLLSMSGGSFYSTYQVFARPGQESSVMLDARKVLREHGGAMPVDDVAKVLWFIPRDTIYHSLSVDDDSINIGSSTWMLAEHFPLTREDAERIGEMLDEVFLSASYVQAFDLIPLLRDRLPSIADNLSGLNYNAVYNIVAYYLKGRFSFTKAIISPKGTSIDFTVIFRSYAAEHDSFTLSDLEALAAELKLPIYWESTFSGGAVRVSKTEFVNRRLIHFDVEATDAALEGLCSGDYLPLMSVSSAMMMHLPSCGYRWNGYLLQSYVHGFSKVFRLSYSSFGKEGYYGAMVRRDCQEIYDYGSLIERVLTDNDSWETSGDALDLLVKQGYQAMRRYKGIDNAMAKARLNKQSTGGR